MTTVTSTRPVTLSRPAREVNGTAVGVALVLGANGLCLVGAGRLVGPAFVGVAVVISYLLARTRPLVALEFDLWLWLLGPQVRRAVDYATVFHDPSIVMIAAPLASLVLLPRLRELRWSGLLPWVRPLLVAAVAIAVGYAVGAVRIGLQPASTALLLWLTPPLLGLQLIVAGRDVRALADMVERVFVWGLLVVGVYGIVQFYVVPGWDAFWMENAPMGSIGTPEPFEVRVFSTLNSPGPLAVFLAAAVLFLTDSRHRLRLVAQIAGYVCLGLSMVRSAWLGCALGLLVILAVGRARAKTTALLAIGVVVVGVLQISGPVQMAIADRIDESREGRQDDSFLARKTFYDDMVPTLFTNVVGQGLGASGVASRLSAEGGLEDVDSGVIDFAYSLGLAGALLALGALVVGGLELTRAGLRGNVVSAGLVAACASIFAQLLSGNTLTGIGGVTFFALWALALRQVLAAPKQVQDHGARGGS